jgi:hypothetical protein
MALANRFGHNVEHHVEVAPTERGGARVLLAREGRSVIAGSITLGPKNSHFT